MRILLISPSKEMFPPAYPLGISYLSEYLHKNGHETSILDLLKEDDEKLALKNEIESFNPDLIGFSIRNIDNTIESIPKLYYANFKELIDFVKSITSTEIILGGAGFSILPDEMLKFYDVKYGIVGEGEMPFLQFVDKMEAGEQIDNIDGLIINHEGVIRKIPHRHNQFFMSENFPLRDSKIIDHYRPDGRIWMNIQAKRGCNQKCIYCVYPVLEGDRFQLRDPRSVGDEIEYLNRELGAEILSFVDGIINMPLDYAEAICHEIIKRDLKLEWNAAFIPEKNSITPEYIRLVRKSGCNVIDFSGTDCASEKMLANMKKPYSKQDIINVSKICKDEGARIVHSLLFGAPGETLDTIRESLDLMEEINPDNVWLSLGIRIYPNTDIEKAAQAEGVIRENEPMLSPKFYISPEIKNENWYELIQSYSSRNPHWSFACLARNFSEWVTEIIKYAEAVQEFA